MNERSGAAFFGFVATVLVNALGIFLFVKVVDWSTSTDFSLSWRNSGLLALIYLIVRFWNTAIFRMGESERGRPAGSSGWDYSRRAPVPPR
jgi:hypothetical protein